MWGGGEGGSGRGVKRWKGGKEGKVDDGGRRKEVGGGRGEGGKEERKGDKGRRSKEERGRRLMASGESRFHSSLGGAVPPSASPRAPPTRALPLGPSLIRRSYKKCRKSIQFQKRLKGILTICPVNSGHHISLNPFSYQ